MASKSDYLKKRKVKKLKDIIDRKVDPGKGNPKTTNRVKTKAPVVKPKTKAGFLEAGKNNMKTEFKDLKKEIKDIKEKKPKIKKPKTAAPKIAPAAVNTTSAIKEGLKFGSKVLGVAGALVSMTEPAGAPKDHPAYESSTVKRTDSYGPVMKGNKENKIPGGTGRSKPGRGISTVNKPSGGPENRQLEKPKGQPYGMTYLQKPKGQPYGMESLQKPKGQPYGMNVAPPGGPPSGKPSAVATAATSTATAGTGTSTGATEKLSAFERMKARQYEREGYGGRVMTRKKATEQVMKERQYKSPLAGLFKRKGK